MGNKVNINTHEYRILQNCSTGCEDQFVREMGYTLTANFSQYFGGKGGNTV